MASLSPAGPCPLQLAAPLQESVLPAGSKLPPRPELQPPQEPNGQALSCHLSDRPQHWPPHPLDPHPPGPHWAVHRRAFLGDGASICGGAARSGAQLSSLLPNSHAGAPHPRALSWPDSGEGWEAPQSTPLTPSPGSTTGDAGAPPWAETGDSPAPPSVRRLSEARNSVFQSRE